MATLKIAQGDTLSAIAKQQGTSVDALVKANPQITDPNLIIAGQDLNLPQIQTPTSGLAETVQPISEEIPVAAGQEALIDAGGTPRPALGEVISQNATSEIQQAIGQEFQSQKESIQKDITGLQETVADREAALEAGLTDDFSRTELRKKLQEEANVKSTEKSLNEIVNQMNDKQLAFQRGKQALVGESSTLRLLRGKEAQLREQFNAEMAWLSGKASIIQGNLNRADDMVKTFFTDSINDRTERINNLKTLFDLDNQKIVKLDAEEKNIGKDQIALLEDMNKRQENEQDDIRQIMINNPEAWEASGATLDMPLDEILDKVTSSAAQLAKFEKAKKGRKDSFSFATADRDRLIGAGLSVDDINNIEDRILAGESIIDILGDTADDIVLSPEQETTIKNSLTGITALQEIDAAKGDEATAAEIKNSQINRAIAIINANSKEKLFGKQGKLEGVTTQELITAINTTLKQEFDQLSINTNDVSELIEETLKIER